GFLDSGDKKKKKEGISSTPSDEFPVLSGIAKNVKNIEGKMNVPKSILKKAVRNIVNDTSPKSGGSFANLLKPNDTTNKIHFRTLVNDERVESVDCVLPKDAPAKVKSRYENSIVGFFLMYNVPVLAYLEDGLSLLATQIGKPIMLDAFTSSMCVESWGRISFARALIEIDAAVGLKNEVSMAIPAEEGDGHIKRDTKATVMEEKDDGFKEVKSRKKKKGADSRSFGGLRLNKPNSKVIWQQKKSGDTKGGTQPSVSIYNNDNGVSNPETCHQNDKPKARQLLNESLPNVWLMRSWLTKQIETVVMELEIAMLLVVDKTSLVAAHTKNLSTAIPETLTGLKEQYD
nr:hypothetical protein [Tanacetum cinerariifolium]